MRRRNSRRFNWLSAIFLELVALVGIFVVVQPESTLRFLDKRFSGSLKEEVVESTPDLSPSNRELTSQENAQTITPTIEALSNFGQQNGFVYPAIDPAFAFSATMPQSLGIPRMDSQFSSPRIIPALPNSRSAFYSPQARAYLNDPVLPASPRVQMRPPFAMGGRAPLMAQPHY